MELRELVDEFVREQESRGNSPKTVEFYRGNLDRLLASTGAQEPAELTEELFTEWRRELFSQDLRAESVATYDRAARIWCTWLERNGYVKANPFRSLPPLRAPRREVLRVLSREDVRAVLGAAKGNLRDTALVALLLDTGIRVGEAASLRMGDVDAHGHAIHVSGKTGGRIVPAHKSLRHVARYVQQGRRGAGTSYLFTTRHGVPMPSQGMTQVVRRLGERAGVQATKLGPHIYRHTFAVEYLRNGGDVFSLMRILGHADIKTTERYVSWLASDLSGLHRSKSPGSHWL